MLSATLYVIGCSAKNRVSRRLARLREPRYVVSAVVGAAYLYFSFIGRMHFSEGARLGRTLLPALIPTFAGAPSVGGLALLVGALLTLAVPMPSGLLTFSRTDREFLFPSPMSRRQLLFYRQLRSQMGVVIAPVVIALTYPLATPGARVRAFVSVWLVLTICQIFFTGIALSRASLAAPSTRARVIAWLPSLVVAASAIAVVLGVVQAVFTQTLEVDSARAMLRLLVDTCQRGWPRIALWPFTAIAAPLFAQTMPAFILTLAGAIAVYLLILGWVLSADEAFDAVIDTTADAPDRPGRGRVSYKPRHMQWTLALEGRQETPFVWKTLTQVLRAVNRRLLIRVAAVGVWLTVVLVMVAGRARGVTQIAGLFAAFAALFVVFFGPQMVRLDLRQDLQHLELLKTWPVRAGTTIRGQILGPTVVVTTVAWALGAVALVLGTAALPGMTMALRVAGGVALMILAPALTLAQFTVHNAAVLFFPAWITTGSARPRGVDAIGQRMIMLGATWLVLIVAVLPGAMVGGGVWWGFQRVIGPWSLIPAALAGALVMLCEVIVATEALGSVYEGLDLTSVERSQV
ncbi:MAG: putative ABC exporter domain-containing protein [Vicinamibacterales bacterium]